MYIAWSSFRNVIRTIFASAGVMSNRCLNYKKNEALCVVQYKYFQYQIAFRDPSPCDLSSNLTLNNLDYTSLFIDYLVENAKLQ